MLLRRQDPNLDPMSFLSGSGEMAARIRAFDWSSHSLGPSDRWPQSLRSALGICLNSAFPTAIYWGSELRLLYNDAWSPIPGPRHPEALGAPAQEVWSDIWHVIEPQLTRPIVTGEGIYLEDEFLPMRRFGTEEETYWSYSFTPIRGESGAIEGIFNSGSETTRSVLERRYAEMLVRLGDAYRASEGAEEMQRTAVALVGECLGMARAGLRMQVRDTDTPPATIEWTAHGVDPLGARIEEAGAAGAVVRPLSGGRVVRLERLEDTQDPDARRFLQSIGAAAVLAIPWVESGRTVAVIYLHAPAPRHWSDLEVATVEKVLERVIRWTEHENIMAREQMMAAETHHRSRNVLALLKSMVRLTEADDADDLRDKLAERIVALSTVHTLLADRNWRGVTLDSIITEELAPYSGGPDGRIAQSGPGILLAAADAQLVAMIVHELVTNAVKYGALSCATGKLDIEWTELGEGGFRLSWRERAPNAEPGQLRPARIGFGSDLLNRVVTEQFGGSLERRLSDDELVYELSLPHILSPDEG